MIFWGQLWPTSCMLKASRYRDTVKSLTFFYSVWCCSEDNCDPCWQPLAAEIYEKWGLTSGGQGGEMSFEWKLKPNYQPGLWPPSQGKARTLPSTAPSPLPSTSLLPPPPPPPLPLFSISSSLVNSMFSEPDTIFYLICSLQNIYVT
jgi:hypothetical protein